MSDRAIAAEIGVSDQTVGRARKKTPAPHVAPEKRTGRDGKTYPAKKKPKAKKPKLTVVPPDPWKIVGAFHHELTDKLNDYCGRLEAFIEANPNLHDECIAGLVQVLEVNSVRLQQLAQQIDDRENGDV